MMTEEQAKDVVWELYSSCTCRPHVEIVAVYGNFVHVHHKSHGSWINRESGKSICEAYHVLIRKGQTLRGWMFHPETEGALYFKGRLDAAKKRQIAWMVGAI